MNISRFLRFALGIALVAGFSTGAFAQATRTWVSGVGDDVNPCSRTAPCKTWAGAISKTAEGGEIDPLDPAGYGTLTITKAIIIDGGTGSGWGHTLSAGSPSGFIVNVTTGTHVSDAVVILRNLTINGAIQSPTVGATQAVNYIKAAQLIIEACHFENVSTTGITQASTATSTVLRVQDSFFDNVGTGILVTTSSGFATAQIDNCRFNSLTGGVNTTNSAFVTISNSMFNGVSGATGGVRANTGCQVNVSNSMFAGCGTGANIAGGTIRLSNNDFFNNTNAIAGGTAESANNNRFRGNVADGNVSNVIVVK
ncbi:MAG: hypothetical protein WAO00_12205 [Chthoniobacterales bacterium]